MDIISRTGRIFYCIAIAGMGVLTICYKSYPYMLFPWDHVPVPGLTYVLGAAFVLAAGCIAFNKLAKQASLLLGVLFLLIFCLCHVPYQFLVSKNYMQLADWENAAKELAFAGGAFAIAGCLAGTNKNPFINFLAKLIPAGAILFALPIISFGILHFVLTKEASTLVPAWIPYPIFWTYMGGVGLLGGGLSILLRIKVGLFATIMGAMIFIWFAILHIPRIAVAAAADMDSETTSAFLALAYSGIAFVVAGMAKSRSKKSISRVVINEKGIGKIKFFHKK